MSKALGSRVVLLGVAACAALGGGCVRLRFERRTLMRPLPSRAEAQLAPGTPLAQCLEQLGAPNFVREQPQGGAALAYAWSRASGWGFGLSTSVADNVDASFDYDKLSNQTRGLLLWFDSEWRLVRAERGRLLDLLSTANRPRPNFYAPRRETEAH